MAMKLYAKYGSDALDILKQNPYRLIDDIEGIGFKRADDMATLFGIKLDDPRRIEAAILFGVRTYSFQKGDTFILDQQLIHATFEILSKDIDERLILDAIQNLIQHEQLIKIDDKYYLNFIYESEQALSKHIKNLITDKIDTDQNEVENLVYLTEQKLGINYTEKTKRCDFKRIKS